MKKFRFKLAHKFKRKIYTPVNRNGRVYPVSVLKKAIKEYNKKNSKTKLKISGDGISVFGELPHPTKEQGSSSTFTVRGML